MRKLLVVALAFGLIASLLVGCGGAESQAIEYIENAKNMAPTESETEDFGTKAQSLSDDLTDGSLTDKAEYDSRMKEVTELVDVQKEKLKKMEAEYEKILDLEGVEDYKEFTKVTIEKVDVSLEFYDTLVAVTEALADAVFTPGGMDDPQKAATIEELYNKLTGQVTKLQELDGKQRELANEMPGIEFDSSANGG